MRTTLITLIAFSCLGIGCASVEPALEDEFDTCVQVCSERATKCGITSDTYGSCEEACAAELRWAESGDVCIDTMEFDHYVACQTCLIEVAECDFATGYAETCADVCAPSEADAGCAACEVARFAHPDTGDVYAVHPSLVDAHGCETFAGMDLEAFASWCQTMDLSPATDVIPGCVVGEDSCELFWLCE